MWYRKSRSQWIQYGDHNTRYFQTEAMIKGEGFTLTLLKPTMANRSLMDSVRSMAISHFQELCRDDRSRSSPHLSDGFPYLGCQLDTFIQIGNGR